MDVSTLVLDVQAGDASAELARRGVNAQTIVRVSVIDREQAKERALRALDDVQRDIADSGLSEDDARDLLRQVRSTM